MKQEIRVLAQLTFEDIEMYNIETTKIKEMKLEKLPQRWFIRWESREHYEVIQGYFNSIRSHNQWTYYVPQHCDSKINQDNKYRSWSDPDFEDSIELSFDDFERLVLKKEFVFVLPEKWYCIYKNQQEFAIANDFFKGNWTYVNVDGEHGFTNVDSNNHWWWKGPLLKYTQINFEQFTNYVLKPKKMEKKVIGYELKEDCKQFIPALAKISYGYAGGCFENGSPFHNHYKAANVLDLWFTPLYEKEREYQVGDWITMLSEYCNEVPKDKTFKLVNFQGGSCWVVEHDGEDSYLAPFTSQFRLATKEEIKKAEDDLLLAEAAKRYPIGTKFYPAHANISSRYCIVTSEIFIIDDNNVIYATIDETKCWDSSGDKKYGNTNLNRIVHINGKWAEICEDVPDITINGYKAIITPFDVTFGCQKYTKAFIMKLWQCLETNDFKMDYKDDIQKLAEYYGRTEN